MEVDRQVVKGDVDDRRVEDGHDRAEDHHDRDPHHVRLDPRRRERLSAGEAGRTDG